MDSVAPTGGQAVGGDGHQARPFQLMEGFAGGIGAAAAAIRHGGDGGMAPPLPIADAEQVPQNELRPGADPHLELDADGRYGLMARDLGEQFGRFGRDRFGNRLELAMNAKALGLGVNEEDRRGGEKKNQAE